MLYILIKISQAKDIFVSYFMDMVKICQAQLHVSYVVLTSKLWLDTFHEYHSLLDCAHDKTICLIGL
jgi:hypothetical protein